MANNVPSEDTPQSNVNTQPASQHEELVQGSEHFEDQNDKIGSITESEDSTQMLLESTSTLYSKDFTNIDDKDNSILNQDDEYSSRTTKKESKLEAHLQKLTAAFLTNLLPDQEKQQKQMSEIMQSQCVLIETIEHENSKFGEIQTIKEVSEIMDRARIYQVKLVNIKKDMMLLHEKANQLKKRALKLQQQKQKEALHREHKRDEELEKEKKLMAKVITRQT